MMGPRFYYEDSGDPGITPLTRKENFLAKIAGLDSAKDLTPLKREEHFLSAIAAEVAEIWEAIGELQKGIEELQDNGGGGGLS